MTHDNYFPLSLQSPFFKAAAAAHPFYLYDFDLLYDLAQCYHSGLQGLKYEIHYAVKANPNLSILSFLENLNVGMDLVSGGELLSCLRAGVNPKHLCFSGVGKTLSELELALQHDIGSISVESLWELKQIEQLIINAPTRFKKIEVLLRINPDLSIPTHPHLVTGSLDTKFGLNPSDFNQALLFIQHSTVLSLKGISCHLGSKIEDQSLFATCFTFLKNKIQELKRDFQSISVLNIGGGLSCGKTPIHNKQLIQNYTQLIHDILGTFLTQNDLTLFIEPGRSLVAHTGFLLGQIIGTKYNTQKKFWVGNVGMNDFMRTVLYQAQPPIWVEQQNNWLKLEYTQKSLESTATNIQLVGPVCESGDLLAQNLLPPPPASGVTDGQIFQPVAGTRIALGETGAYGHSMSHSYNLRPKLAEFALISTSLENKHPVAHWCQFKQAEKQPASEDQMLIPIRRMDTWAEMIQQEIN